MIQVPGGESAGAKEESAAGGRGGDHLQVWPPAAAVPGCPQTGDCVPLQCLQVREQANEELESLTWNVFRYYEPSPATGPCFVAVRRDRCRVVVTRPAQEAENLLMWWNSSEFARRGRCRGCGTSLVMDFQWFEPNTVWLIRPSWTKVSFSFPHFSIFFLSSQQQFHFHRYQVERKFW